tara:strand:- start:268 stop:1215 length:948 start_codon:yes stop_codon:yes gene_type:complete
MSIDLVALTEPDQQAWQALTASIHRLPLTQSWAYAEALASARGWLPTYYRVEQDGAAIGGCLVQEKHSGLSKTIHIERGPFFIAQPSPEQFGSVVRELATLTKPRWFDRRRFYPEVAETSPEAALILDNGFRRLETGYQTIWLDLAVPLIQRRQAMRQNWRSALSKAERSKLEIAVDGDASNLNWLAAHHISAMRKQHYIGPSGPLLFKLAELSVPTGDFCLIRAKYLGKPVAGALFIRHGMAATYLIGWSGKVGRKYNAQHAILWQALETLAGQGVTQLDLGGINPERASGVTYFKRGMITGADQEATGAPICR